MFSIFDHPHPTTHPPFADHLLGIPGRHLDIPTGSARDIPQKHLLRHPSTHGHAKIIDHFLAAVPVPIFGRQHHGHTQRRPTGNNGNLVQRVGVLEGEIQHRMSRLVVSRELLLLVAHRQAPPFTAESHLVAGLLQIVLGDGFCIPPGRE